MAGQRPDDEPTTEAAVVRRVNDNKTHDTFLLLAFDGYHLWCHGGCTGLFVAGGEEGGGVGGAK